MSMKKFTTTNAQSAPTHQVATKRDTLKRTILGLMEAVLKIESDGLVTQDPINPYKIDGKEEFTEMLLDIVEGKENPFEGKIARFIERYANTDTYGIQVEESVSKVNDPKSLYERILVCEKMLSNPESTENKAELNTLLSAYRKKLAKVKN
jgi:hypothetical protein